MSVVKTVAFLELLELLRDETCERGAQGTSCIRIGNLTHACSEQINVSQSEINAN